MVVVWWFLWQLGKVQIDAAFVGIMEKGVNAARRSGYDSKRRRAEQRQKDRDNRGLAMFYGVPPSLPHAIIAKLTPPETEVEPGACLGSSLVTNRARYLESALHR